MRSKAIDNGELQRTSILMELINNRITTLKTQNSNNHAIEIWTLKANFIKNSLIHDQSIVIPFGKAN